MHKKFFVFIIHITIYAIIDPKKVATNQSDSSFMNETINECIQKLDQKEYDCLKRIVINKWLCNSLDDCPTYERKKLEAECCSFYDFYDCVIKEFKTVEECDSEAKPRKDRLKKQLDSKEYNCNQYPKGWKHCRQVAVGSQKDSNLGHSIKQNILYEGFMAFILLIIIFIFR
jgi:hypothetical protein